MDLEQYKLMLIGAEVMLVMFVAIVVGAIIWVDSRRTER